MDYEFEIYEQGDYRVITAASGYDPEISYNGVTHHVNWWIHLLCRDGDYHLEVQIGNHNAVLMEVDRDGSRGVDLDELEVDPIGKYRVKLLVKAIGFVKEHERSIVHAMEALYQDGKVA